MNAQEFYEYFKDALTYLDEGFSGMNNVIVCIRGDRIVLMCGDKEASIKLPKGD
jgi:hypothetical protein